MKIHDLLNTEVHGDTPRTMLAASAQLLGTRHRGTKSSQMYSRHYVPNFIVTGQVLWKI